MGARYDTTYTWPAVTATGAAKEAYCQPFVDSPVNVSCASRVPLSVQIDPTWVPVLATLL